MTPTALMAGIAHKKMAESGLFPMTVKTGGGFAPGVMKSGGRPMQQKIIKIVAVNDRGCRIGQYHHNAKLSDEVIDRIRAMHEDDGIGYRMIAKLLNISRHTIRDICRYSRRAQTYEHWKKLTMIVEVQEETVRVAETV